jgi:hypothetical protein
VRALYTTSRPAATRRRLQGGLLIGHLKPSFSDPGSFCAHHLLVLDEGHRAAWRIVPLDVGPSRRGGASQLEWDRPSAPRHLLAHLILAYLASAEPDCLTRAGLRRYMHRATPQHIDTDIPDEHTAQRVLAALPEDVAVILTVMPGSTLHPLEAAPVGASPRWTINLPATERPC